MNKIKKFLSLGVVGFVTTENYFKRKRKRKRLERRKKREINIVITER